MNERVEPPSTGTARRLADPVAVFRARASARAHLWANCYYTLHEAVDVLQAAAVATGLVDQLGQDEVQRILAEAFAPYRVEAASLPPSDRVPDELPEPERKSGVPISTLWAAEYLVREGNVARLQRLLARHSAAERAVIRQHLRGRS
jgi:hypothetical protein